MKNQKNSKANKATSIKFEDGTIREIKIHGKKIKVMDYRTAIKDFRELSGIESAKVKPKFIPRIDEGFFKSQKYSLPVVKMDEETYIFPTNAKATNCHSTLEDYSNFCITNLELLVATQHYYYHKAKVANDQNPLVFDGYKVPFRKRGCNSMSWVQFNLSSFIHGDNLWNRHGELQDELKFKENDIKFQTEELENVFAKGEYTSYGNDKLNSQLFEDYGVKVKLQNGQIIQEHEIKIIEKGLLAFYKTFEDLTNICKSFSLKISYSHDKYMHARNASGVFCYHFNAIGISGISNPERVLAHELGHFIDFHLGGKNYRYYLSDDKNSLAGEIATQFRKNTLKKQRSAYQNRTTECFARAIEQYFSIANNITIQNHDGNYCTTEIFNKHLSPLILQLISQLKLISKAPARREDNLIGS